MKDGRINSSNLCYFTNGDFTMAIYDAGTASLAPSGAVTGAGTAWVAPLTLIRVGATIVFKTEPVKIYTISEIISDTRINVYNPNSETVPAGTGYAILIHDGLTVQGLAQDVAETLRYYQTLRFPELSSDGAVLISDGGTGATTAEQARKNFGIDRFKQYENGTSILDNVIGHTFFMSPGDWGYVSNSTNKRVALPIESGGTGATTAELARNSLDVYSKSEVYSKSDVYSKSEVDDKTSRFEQNPDSTIIDSGTNLYKFFVGEADWGYFRSSDSQRIPLAVISGGTGGANPMQASNNIEAAFINYPATTSYGSIDLKTGFGIFDNDRSPYPGGDGAPFTYSTIFTIAEGGGGTGNYSQVGFSTITEQAPRYRQRLNSPARITKWRDFFVRDLNTTVDPGGFIKIASPIVKVFHDGSFESSESAQGVIVSRESEGVYFVTGCKGLNSDASWGGVDGGFEIPLDKNKQPKIWIDYDVLSDGSLRVRTYHREHKDSPSFARNLIDGYSDGQPIDIPKDSFVSVRVNM